jgi:hypothetical protein
MLALAISLLVAAVAMTAFSDGGTPWAGILTLAMSVGVFFGWFRERSARGN